MSDVSRRRSRIRALVVAATVLLGVAAVGAGPAGAVDDVRVTVTVHHVWELDCDDNDALDLTNTCGNDYYAKAFFPDGERRSPRAPDDRSEITPNWQLSGIVDRDAGPFGVRLQLWDHDSTSGDDLIDIAPPGSDRNLDITVDPRTGDFSGDVFTPNIGFGKGAGSDSAAIWFSVTLGDSVDFDGDGLHDGIERSAIITDSNGTIPQNGVLRSVAANGAPAQPASPCRPTILVEVDWMTSPGFGGHSHRPTQAAIDEAVSTMDRGDVPARPGCPYTGAAAGSGVQLLMVLDDDLPEVDEVDWDSGPGATTGQSIRNANFDAGLRPYFHYSLWIHNQPDTPPTTPGGPSVVNGSSGLCCSDSGKDVLVSLGQWTGSVGTTRHQSGTFIHELGHALGLGHGGVDDLNCKPNYLSIMSYVYQTTGIPDASLPAPTVDLNGDTLVDGRDRLRMDLSRTKLDDLDEDALDEGAGIGAGPDTFVWDGDGTRPWRSSAGDVAVDWDRDGAIDAADVAADVDFMGIRGQGCPTATPPPGTVGTPELLGHDDWANLEYKGPLAPPSSGVSSADELDKTTADFIAAALREALSVTDLSVQLTDAPDPVAAGTRLTYTLTARNLGTTNTAYQASARQPLPVEVAFVSASPGCTHSAGTVTCALGDLAPGASATRTVTVAVPPDLVADRGGPTTISSTATVSHDGPDPAAGNDSATASTLVIAVADVRVTAAATTGPLEVLVGQSGTLTTRLTIDNLGPSSPIDTVLTTTASGAGVTVTPATATTQQPLAVGSPRTVATSTTVRCDAPGVTTITVTGSLALKNAADVDPDLSNNTSTSTAEVDCVIPIAVNVRPGGFPNAVNLNTDATLAALTTGAGEYGLPLAVDATQIIATSVRWGLRENLFDTATPTGAAEIHTAAHLERSYELDDRTRDRDVDAVMHFKPADSGLTLSTTDACLKGRLQGPGTTTFTFLGCDAVRVVN